MAEITKLSVGQALDKLRGTESLRSNRSQIDEKINALDEEISHVRAMRHRVERGQQAVSNPVGAQDTNSKPNTRHTLAYVALATAIALLALAWLWIFI